MRTFDIVIPVFNALAALKACMAAVLAHTDPRHPIYLFDDASTDPEVQPYLLGLAAAHRHLKVHRSDTNQGFLLTANQGFRQSRNDLLLLNSDTLVPRRWVERLTGALESRPSVGIVSPLFSCAYYLSFPKAFVANYLPDGSFSDFCDRLAEVSPRAYPSIPAGLGCCMAIKREVIDALGAFELAFGAGYWEDVDYSFRAKEKGFESVCADDLFVYHHGSKSFGVGARATYYIYRNLKLMATFWPGFEDRFLDFLTPHPFRSHIEAMNLSTRYLASDLVSASGATFSYYPQ